MDQDYYSKLLAEHGPTYRAVDAGSVETLQRRHRVLTSMIPDMHSSVLDIGCGLGHLIDYGYGIHPSGYYGIDILPEMIVAARLRRPGWRFEVGDILHAKEAWVADYVVASGLFQFADWNFVNMAMGIMWALCRKGMAVNFLRHGDPSEFVIPPWMLIEEGLPTPWFTVRADYLPNDWTLYLWKENPHAPKL